MRRSSWMVVALMAFVLVAAGGVGAQDDPFDQLGPSDKERIETLEAEVDDLRDRVDYLESVVGDGSFTLPVPTTEVGPSGDLVLRGTIEVSGSLGEEVITNGDDCEGLPGDDAFGGLSGGDPVYVYHGAAIIGTGAMEDGEVVARGSSRVTCSMPFRVSELPEVDAYEVVVGDGGWSVVFTASDLEAENWDVQVFISS